MALIPSTTLLYAHALSLLTISYFLLFSPIPLLTTPSLLILGEAMHIRPASFQPSPSRLSKGLATLSSQSTELLAIIGVLLIGYSIVEILFTSYLSIPSLLQNQSQPPESTTSSKSTKSNRARTAESLSILTASQSTHLSLAFLHIIFNGLLCSWIYIFHSTRSSSQQQQSFLSSRSTPTSSSTGGGGLNGLGNILGNQVIFSAALMDMLFWGYLWTVIRDERREVLEKVQRLKGEGVDDEEED